MDHVGRYTISEIEMGELLTDADEQPSCKKNKKWNKWLSEWEKNLRIKDKNRQLMKRNFGKETTKRLYICHDNMSYELLKK